MYIIFFAENLKDSGHGLVTLMYFVFLLSLLAYYLFLHYSFRFFYSKNWIYCLTSNLAGCSCSIVGQWNISICCPLNILWVSCLLSDALYSKNPGILLKFHCWCHSLYSRLYSASSIVPEKAMAPHSSTPAWEIPWAEEPGRLQSMGSLGVRHDWATSLSLFTFMHWRRKWQPTPVFLPGESQGRGSLVGYRLWGRTELDTTEVT